MDLLCTRTLHTHTTLVVFVIEFKEEMIFAAMKRLQDLGASSFILDLRENRGGLVQVCLYLTF